MVWTTWQQEVLGDWNKDARREDQEAVGYVGLQLRGGEAGKKDFGVSALRW